MTTPTTEAGRALLRSAFEAGLAPGFDAGWILAIEAEARAAVLDEVAEKVKGLDAPGGQWSERGFEKARAAVLALIASLRNRSGGGHSAGAGHFTTRKPSRNRGET